MVYIGIRVNDLRDIDMGFSFSIDLYDDSEGSYWVHVLKNDYRFASFEEAHQAAVDWLDDEYGECWSLV